MIHHPMILVPKLIVLIVIVIVLIILHGMLPPDQFRIAVIAAAVLFVVFTVALWTAVAKLLSDPNSRASRMMVLSREAKSADGYKAADDRYAHLVGKAGVAVSNLSPSGTALIDGEQVSVMTAGQFVEADEPVVVVEVHGAKIVVKHP